MTLALLVLAPAALGLLALCIENIRIDLAILLSAAILHLLATVFLWSTSVLFLAASVYAVPYVLEGTHDEQAAPRRFVPCLLWFLAAMTLVAVTQHLALMWAAVEGTTLASAPLVYFYRRRGALEATWKYLLLCSVGIALALLGTFFLGIAASGGPGAHAGFTLEALRSAAPSMGRPW